MENNNDSNIRLQSEAEFTNERMSRAAMRRFIGLFILLAFALLLCVFRLKLPVVPSLIAVDFSVLPELIASIAYGPIAGLVVTLLKFAIHTALTENTFYSNVANFFIEGTFIVFAEIFYTAYLSDQFQKGQELNRSKALFRGSLWAIVPTLIVQFFIQQFYLFPKLDWNFRHQGITTASLIAAYANSVEIIRNHMPIALQGLLPKVTAIWQGIIFINFPITFVKLIIVILIAIPIYKSVSPALHLKSK